MKFDKLYSKYINLICKKFYLLGLLYLFIHIFFVYLNINSTHFLFIFQLEKIDLIEIILFLIINLICIFSTQFIISKILIKNSLFIIISLIFIIPLIISYLYIFYDILIYIGYLIFDDREIIISYILQYTS